MALDRRQFLIGGALAATGSNALAQTLRLSTPDVLLSLACTKGQPARLISLRNQRSSFEWAAANQITAPAFSSETLIGPDWTVGEAYRKNAGELQIHYSLSGKLKAEQRCRVLSDVPVIELGCNFRSATSEGIPAVTGFGPIRLALRPGLGPLQVHCVRRDTYATERLPFENTLDVHGGRWNCPEHSGLLVLEAMDSREFLIIGIEWERGWRYGLTRSDGGVWVQIDIADLRHDLGPAETLESPPVFLALAGGDVDEAFGVAQGYLKKHLFPKPLADSPWVVYDIWGTESQGVEQALLDEIEVAAKLGVELYYVDAAWYKDSSKKGNGDWGCGLGNYTEDREKFPHGLAYFSEKVHARGMKFGLWVGPNIVDSRLIPGTIPQRWVAQVDGIDRVLRIKTWEAPCNQVCLGCREYIDHLKTNLSRIVEAYKLDWLKWDNSGLPGRPAQCNRADHGHQSGDGSYASLAGQYEIFRHLHEKFPNLVLEQCGYGSRLDYGLARTIRANWLSDASFPSSHVRENALIASHIYPSFYNGAWIVRDPELEKTKDPDMLDTIYRSRMLGLFGFGTLHGTMPERVSLYSAEVLEAARRNIPLYKKYRHLLHGRSYHLFPPSGSPEQWQAVEFANGAEAVVLCFRGKSTQSAIRLPLRGLHEVAIYRVTSANEGTVVTATGRKLMREGLIATLPKPDGSDIFLLNG